MKTMYAPFFLLCMLVGVSGHFFRPPFMRRGFFPFPRPMFAGFRPGFHPLPIGPMFAPRFAPWFSRGAGFGFTGGRRSALARSLASTLAQGGFGSSSLAASGALGGNANVMSNVGGNDLGFAGSDVAQATAFGNIANSVSNANTNGITVVDPFGSIATQLGQGYIDNEMFDARPNPQTGMNTATTNSVQEIAPEPMVTVTVQEPGTTGSGITTNTGAPAMSGYTVDTGAPSGSGYTGDTGAPAMSGYTVDTGANSGSGYTVGTGATSGSGYTGDTGAPAMSGYTVDTGANSGSGYTVGTGAPSGSGYTGDTGAPAMSGYIVDTGAPSGSGYTGDTGAPAMSGYTGDTGAPSGSGYTVDTGAPAMSGYTVGTGAPAGSGITVDTGATSGSGYTVDTGAPAISDYTVDTGAPSGSGYTVGTGATSGSGYTGDTGAPAMSGYIVDTGAPSGSGYTVDTGAPAISDYTVDTGAPSGSGYTVETGAPAGSGYTANTGATGSGFTEASAGSGYNANTGATGSSYSANTGATGSEYTADIGGNPSGAISGYDARGAAGTSQTTNNNYYDPSPQTLGGSAGFYDPAALNSLVYLDAPSSPSSGEGMLADKGTHSNQIQGAASTQGDLTATKIGQNSGRGQSQGNYVYRQQNSAPTNNVGAMMTDSTGYSGTSQGGYQGDLTATTLIAGQMAIDGQNQGAYDLVQQDRAQSANSAGSMMIQSAGYNDPSLGGYPGQQTSTTGGQGYKGQAAGNMGGAQGGIISLNEVMGGQQQGASQSRNQGAPMYETGMGQMQNGYDFGVGNSFMEPAMQAGQPLFDGNQGNQMYDTRGSGGAYSPDMLPSLHNENQPMMGYDGMGSNQGFEQMSALPGTSISQKNGPMGSSVMTVTQGLPMASDFPQSAEAGGSVNTPGYMQTRSVTVTM